MKAILIVLVTFFGLLPQPAAAQAVEVEIKRKWVVINNQRYRMLGANVASIGLFGQARRSAGQSRIGLDSQGYLEASNLPVRGLVASLTQRQIRRLNARASLDLTDPRLLGPLLTAGGADAVAANAAADAVAANAAAQPTQDVASETDDENASTVSAGVDADFQSESSLRTGIIFITAEPNEVLRTVVREYREALSSGDRLIVNQIQNDDFRFVTGVVQVRGFTNQFFTGFSAGGNLRGTIESLASGSVDLRGSSGRVGSIGLADGTTIAMETYMLCWENGEISNLRKHRLGSVGNGRGGIVGRCKGR